MNSKWIETSNSYINSHVKFKSINKKRIVNVLADYNTLFLFFENFFGTVRDPNAFTLRFVVRFNNVPFAYFLLFTVFNETGGLIGQNVCNGKEVVVSRVFVFHF